MIAQTDPPQFYAIKLVTGGPRCGCKVWYGAPTDPETGEELDRSPRWQVWIGGELQDDPFRVVMLVGNVGYVKGEEIDEAEYAHLLSVRAWAVEHSPQSPEANPRAPIDLHRLPSVF